MTLGNFFNIANIRKPADIYQVRQERIKREGSPYYSWAVPATAAAASSNIHVPTQFPAARKYEPLDWLEIVNNEAVNNLNLTINGQDTFPVPAGTIRTIDGKALWTLLVTNNGAVITTLNNIIVTLRRQPMTIDKWTRNQR